MAVDQWVPKRFAHLSERLVTQNGIIFMGLAAIATLVYTGGQVKLLVSSDQSDALSVRPGSWTTPFKR